MKITLKQKIEVYESFLSKLASSNKEAIDELVRNADRWAYARKQPAEEQETERLIAWTFRTLCSTPATDSKERKRLRELQKKKK